MLASIAEVLRDSWRIFSGRGARFLGAAVAFYSLLSAAPLFLVTLHVVGAFFGRGRAEEALFSGLGVWLAPEGVTAVRRLTHDFEAHGSQGVIGVLLVLYGATRLFRAMRRALNTLWGVDLAAVEEREPTVARYAKRYGVALLLAALVTVLVLAMLVIKLGFAVVARWGLTEAPRVMDAAELGVNVLLAFMLFAALYALLPAVKVSARHVLFGAALSTILFAAGSYAVSAYLRHKAIGDLYEGAGALVLAVLWVYYSAQVFFLGASVTAALREREARVYAG
ncbi:MAG: YihY/virulence factor BrkB family protein [Myxococcales bacterium]|nr:YihY/virulence factor BrkB family protein [Myxococcales bacterium]